MTRKLSTLTPLLTCLTLASLVGCAEDLDDGNPEALEERGGEVPGRWLMTADIADISKTVHLAIDGSPLGAHKASNCTQTFLPGSQVLKDYLTENFDGIIYIGGYNCRPIDHNPAKQTSIHGLGRALDIHVTCPACAANNEVGDEIAHWLIAHAEEIGIQRIIWDQSSWKSVGLSQTYEYGGGHLHNDHLHVELNLDGGYATTPWFENGGFEIPPLPGEPVPPPDPPPQDDCPNPCWPDYDLGTVCGDGEVLECGDFDDDGCTELKVVEACGAGASCHGEGYDQAMCCNGAFCDDEGSIFENNIDYIAAHGITKGCGEGMGGQPNYCPSEAATRAQVLTMLARASGMPTGGHPDAFTDDEGHWAENVLNAAYHYGITSGIGDGLFGPQLDATRTHVAAFIVNTYNLPPAASDYFDDDDGDPSWKQDVHNRLYEAGITQGCGDREYCGSESVTREQLAAFITRAHQNLAKPSW